MISMQFKTWLRLHEAKKDAMARDKSVEESQQSINATNHRDNTEDVIKANRYPHYKISGSTHAHPNTGIIEPDLTLGIHRNDHKTHTRVELKSVSNTESGNPQEIKITHRQDDPLVGSGKDSKTGKVLTVEGLEDLLKSNWKRKYGEIVRDANGNKIKSPNKRLTTPSYAVYEHIRDNHPMGKIRKNRESRLDELIGKKINNLEDFDKHFKNKENRKKWKSVSTKFWHSIKTPMNFDVLVTSLGHVMCVHKNKKGKEYNRALRDCRNAGLIPKDGTFTDDIKDYTIRGGFAKTKRVDTGGDTRQSRIQREHKSPESQALKVKREFLKQKLDKMKKIRMIKGAAKKARKTTRKEFNL